MMMTMHIILMNLVLLCIRMVGIRDSPRADTVLSLFWRSVVATALLHPTSPTVSGGSWHWRPPSPALVSHSNSDCPPVRQSTLGDRSFSVAAARAWNSLPSAVRAASSLTTFRRALKTFLLSLLHEFSGPLVTNSLFPPVCYILVPYWLCKVPLQRSVR